MKCGGTSQIIRLDLKLVSEAMGLVVLDSSRQSLGQV